jgi:hypothetical protein
MHSERGQETIEHIVRMYAGHDLNHLQQIQNIVGTAKKNQNPTAKKKSKSKSRAKSKKR